MCQWAGGNGRGCVLCDGGGLRSGRLWGVDGCTRRQGPCEAQRPCPPPKRGCVAETLGLRWVEGQGVHVCV
jgi:hypothetical protein